MKDKTTRQGQVVAAAILLALGVSPAVAQQTGSPDEGQWTEQQQQTEQRGAERDWQTDQDRAQRDWETEQRQAEGDWQADQPEFETDRPDEDEFAVEPRDEPRFADDEPRDIAETARADLEQLAREHGKLSKFVEAVKAAGMEDSLTDGTAYTIFAPTDDAFDQMDAEVTFESENWEEVAELLRGHIVADDVDSDMLRRLPQAMTIDGGMVEISERDGDLHVQDALVEEDVIQIGSVRIYPIDSVLQRGPGAARPAQDQPEETDTDADDFGGLEDG
jgi:uncharacterized surface protein with fasciclin (FAS1) repeats